MDDLGIPVDIVNAGVDPSGGFAIGPDRLRDLRSIHGGFSSWWFDGGTG